MAQCFWDNCNSAFNEKLCNRFDSQYPANCWRFEQFLLFLSAEVAYVGSLHLMQVDICEPSCGRAEPSVIASLRVELATHSKFSCMATVGERAQ